MRVLAGVLGVLVVAALVGLATLWRAVPRRPALPAAGTFRLDIGQIVQSQRSFAAQITVTAAGLPEGGSDRALQVTIREPGMVGSITAPAGPDGRTCTATIPLRAQLVQGRNGKPRLRVDRPVVTAAGSVGGPEELSTTAAHIGQDVALCVHPGVYANGRPLVLATIKGSPLTLEVGARGRSAAAATRAPRP